MNMSKSSKKSTSEEEKNAPVGHPVATAVEAREIRIALAPTVGLASTAVVAKYIQIERESSQTNIALRRSKEGSGDAKPIGI